MADVQEAAPAVVENDSIESNESQESSGINPDVGAATEAAKASEAQKVEARKKLKKLSLKVDGQDLEEELPFEIDDDPKAVEFMRKHLQMSKMANKRAQESALIQKQVMSFVEQLRKDPRKALSDPRIGVDLKKLAYEMLEEEVENSKKSPEQLEKEKLEAELKAIREERQKEKEEMQQKELERLQEQEFMKLDATFSQALEGSDLPKSPYVVKKMAEVMLSALEGGMKVEPKDVIPQIRGEIISDIKEMFSVMPAEVVQEILGSELLGKIRKNNVAKAKEAQVISKAKQVADTGSKKVEEKKVEKKTIKELFGV